MKGRKNRRLLCSNCIDDSISSCSSCAIGQYVSEHGINPDNIDADVIYELMSSKDSYCDEDDTCYIKVHNASYCH